MKVDAFTQRAIQRAESGANNLVGSGNVGIAWMALLGPIIQAAMMTLMDQFSSCGQTPEQRIKAINSRNTLAQFQVRKAVNEAIAEELVSWRDVAQLRKFASNAILDEAKETPDEEINDALVEIDNYNFNPSSAWDIARGV